ncbi:MBL fold metallo-hydrolase [Pseudomonadales bacterium]|nr:MBL fold metallo-hydrolase [Pseudomonadales bacterium]
MELQQRQIGPLTILFGKDNGKYPQGNSLLIQGSRSSAIIDPSLGIVARQDNLPQVDMVLHSHVHEDHVAGSHLFPDVPWHAHVQDLPGLASLEGLLDIYGFEGEIRQSFEQTVLEEFHYQSHRDIHGFEDGDQFDFGGVRLTVMHIPGHTRGHCCFIIDWDGSDERLVYLGDIELTGFGPYYGDAWSDLEDFEVSLEKLRHLDAHWWLTFHHKGLIEGRAAFLPMLADFTAMIDYREQNLLAYLVEPRSMADIVAHRFIYRPGTEGVFVDAVERRSMGMHLARLIRDQRVTQVHDQYQVVPS